MLSYSLCKCFCCLCTIFHLEYVLIFSAICNLWKCRDVLTDFTMWREINMFISVLGLVCCVWSVMYFTLTIFLKKSNPGYSISLEMLHVFKIEHHRV